MNKLILFIALCLLGCTQSEISTKSANATSQPKPENQTSVASNTDLIYALPFAPGVDPLSVCGPVDDLEHVEYFSGSIGENAQYAADHQASTVQFQWLASARIREILGPGSQAGNIGSVRWCTGTLLEGNKILTAAHCFPDDSDDWELPSVNGQVTKAAVNATLMQVVFNYQLSGNTGADRRVETYAVKQLLEHWNGGLDYAVIELGGVIEENSEYSLTPAQISTRVVESEEILAIIQHPRGQRKKIHSGRSAGLVGPLLHYGNIDTHGGSSGSGIRDKDGVVVGVHIQGGCRVTSGTNKGVALSEIANHSSFF
ncbi:MAG: serine protease [Pseudomonadota bacterium]